MVPPEKARDWGGGGGAVHFLFLLRAVVAEVEDPDGLHETIGSVGRTSCGDLQHIN